MKKHIKKAGGELFRRALSYGRYPALKIILMYHRVCEKMPGELHDPAMFVTARTLDMHLREIKRYFDIVPVDRLAATRRDAARQCALTFDDGWLDNYTVARPILKKHGVPATVFIPLESMKVRSTYWFQTLWDIANTAAKRGKNEELLDYLSAHVGTRFPRQPVQESMCSVINALKDVPPRELDRIIDEACAHFGVEQRRDDDLLTEPHMREMSSEGITFGAHGLTHAILTRVSSGEKQREIAGSREQLNASGFARSDIFSYPNGDWDEETAVFTREAGYQGAVTTQLGTVEAESRPFQLRRIAVHDEISNTPALLWFRIFQAARRVADQ